MKNIPYISITLGIWQNFVYFLLLCINILVQYGFWRGYKIQLGIFYDVLMQYGWLADYEAIAESVLVQYGNSVMEFILVMSNRDLLIIPTWKYLNTCPVSPILNLLVTVPYTSGHL